MGNRWGILTFLLRLVGTILALVAVISVNNAHLRVTEIREEPLTAVQGLSMNDLRTLSTWSEAVAPIWAKYRRTRKLFRLSCKPCRRRLGSWSKVLLD